MQKSKPKIVTREGHPNSCKCETCVCDYAAAIYARVFLYVYIISVSLKDLIIISVVITVDVKVYTEAMLINTIYLYLIFRL